MLPAASDNFPHEFRYRLSIPDERHHRGSIPMRNIGNPSADAINLEGQDKSKYVEHRVRRTREHERKRRRFGLIGPHPDLPRSRLVTSSVAAAVARFHTPTASPADDADNDEWTSSDDASAGNTDDACWSDLGSTP